MSRNTRYLVAGFFAAALIIVGYFIYQDSQRTHIDIQVDDNGISIDGN